MSLNSDDIDHLNLQIERNAAATERAAKELELQRQESAVMRKTQQRQGFIQLSVLICIVLLVLALGSLWHSQRERTQIARQTRATASLIASCTTPDGECKKHGDEQLNIALAYLRDSERLDRLQDNIASAQAQGNSPAVDAYSKIAAQVSQQVTEETNQLKALQAQPQ